MVSEGDITPWAIFEPPMQFPVSIDFLNQLRHFPYWLTAQVDNQAGIWAIGADGSPSDVGIVIQGNGGNEGPSIVRRENRNPIHIAGQQRNKIAIMGYIQPLDGYYISFNNSSGLYTGFSGIAVSFPDGWYEIRKQLPGSGLRSGMDARPFRLETIGTRMLTPSPIPFAHAVDLDRIT